VIFANAYKRYHNMVITQILPFLVSIGALINIFLHVYRQRKSGLRIDYPMVALWFFLLIVFMYVGFSRL